MEEEKQVLIKVVTEKLQSMANTSMKNVVRSKRSIYRIPASVTAHNKTAYMPQTVSFGPYHHDDIHLKPMEEHKQRALGFFLQKTGIPLQSVVESLNDEMQVLKDSYDMLDESWKNDTSKFLQLMILDGCFMLEIIRLAKPDSPEYSADDPVFSRHGRLYMIPHIRRDMLLLENQLPMLVLYRLVAAESDGAKDEEWVNELIRNFIHPGASASSLGKCLHVLDLYRKSLLQRDPIKKKRRPREKGGLHGDDNDIIRSATEINEAGIQFKKSKSKSLKEISFHRGVLELPVIEVDDTTEATLLNLMAFERFHVGAGNETLRWKPTATLKYCKCMSMLIARSLGMRGVPISFTPISEILGLFCLLLLHSSSLPSLLLKPYILYYLTTTQITLHRSLLL